MFVISTDMIYPTSHRVSTYLIQQCANDIDVSKLPMCLNQPTGNFFTDPWIIKKEYKNTKWEKLLQSLSEPIGQARLIRLKPATCYHNHADIDDRYHLNISGEMNYLVDIDNNCIHSLEQDGLWYYMDAGKVHSAVNFGRYDRIQMVVRKLLPCHTLQNPVKIEIVSKNLSVDDARYIFDNSISPWLNRSSKDKKITDFSHCPEKVNFLCEATHVSTLKKIIPTGLEIIYDR